MDYIYDRVTNLLTILSLPQTVPYAMLTDEQSFSEWIKPATTVDEFMKSRIQQIEIMDSQEKKDGSAGSPLDIGEIKNEALGVLGDLSALSDQRVIPYFLRINSLGRRLGSMYFSNNKMGSDALDFVDAFLKIGFIITDLEDGIRNKEDEFNGKLQLIRERFTRTNNNVDSWFNEQNGSEVINEMIGDPAYSAASPLVTENMRKFALGTIASLAMVGIGAGVGFSSTMDGPQYRMSVPPYVLVGDTVPVENITKGIMLLKRHTEVKGSSALRDVNDLNAQLAVANLRAGLSSNNTTTALRAVQVYLPFLAANESKLFRQMDLSQDLQEAEDLVKDYIENGNSGEQKMALTVALQLEGDLFKEINRIARAKARFLAIDHIVDSAKNVTMEQQLESIELYYLSKKAGIQEEESILNRKARGVLLKAMASDDRAVSTKAFRLATQNPETAFLSEADRAEFVDAIITSMYGSQNRSLRTEANKIVYAYRESVLDQNRFPKPHWFFEAIERYAQKDIVDALRSDNKEARQSALPLALRNIGRFIKTDQTEILAAADKMMSSTSLLDEQLIAVRAYYQNRDNLTAYAQKAALDPKADAVVFVALDSNDRNEVAVALETGFNQFKEHFDDAQKDRFTDKAIEYLNEAVGEEKTGLAVYYAARFNKITSSIGILSRWSSRILLQITPVLFEALGDEYIGDLQPVISAFYSIFPQLSYGERERFKGLFESKMKAAVRNLEIKNGQPTKKSAASPVKVEDVLSGAERDALNDLQETMLEELINASDPSHLSVEETSQYENSGTGSRFPEIVMKSLAENIDGVELKSEFGAPYLDGSAFVNERVKSQSASPLGKGLEDKEKLASSLEDEWLALRETKISPDNADAVLDYIESLKGRLIEILDHGYSLGTETNTILRAAADKLTDKGPRISNLQVKDNEIYRHLKAIEKGVKEFKDILKTYEYAKLRVNQDIVTDSFVALTRLGEIMFAIDPIFKKAPNVAQDYYQQTIDIFNENLDDSSLVQTAASPVEDIVAIYGGELGFTADQFVQITKEYEISKEVNEKLIDNLDELLKGGDQMERALKDITYFSNVTLGGEPSDVVEKLMGIAYLLGKLGIDNLDENLETTKKYLKSELGIAESPLADQRTSINDQLDKDVGGIDLNPNAIDMHLDRENGQGLIVPVATPEMIELLHGAEGFLPVILNVAPVVNLPLLLGLDIPEERTRDVSYDYRREPMDRRVARLEDRT